MLKLFASIVFVLLAGPLFAQSPVSYTVSFPEPHHRWLQVEVIFPDLEPAALEARMSRVSPGRYALHEFAKNVFDVRAYDGSGRELSPARPDPHQWDVDGHDGSVRIAYKVYGDRIDGTYLSVDARHAHMNMPATLMWARGLEDRQARVRFEPPEGSDWDVATQLFGTDDPHTFTAPNLQYLLDSPTKLGTFSLRTFTVEGGDGPPARIRIAIDHDGTAADEDAYVSEVEQIVRETMPIFGEFPVFDNGSYLFIATYLPWASGDGMEHRNSTILTSSQSIRTSRRRLLGTVAHEFFHAWNVERIRPASLEPFDFEKANMSGDLWLGEGFTSYYDTLILQRAGLATLEETLGYFGFIADLIVNSPGRRLRSIEEMSLLAPFIDAARPVDRTYWENTYISYYPGGAAIALALDLTLRGRTNGRVTLDDYMQAMWEAHGLPEGSAVGYVGAPYTAQDARDRLAAISGDRAFADEFFERYIHGREAADYGHLLAQAGLVLRQRHPGRAWIGNLRLQFDNRGAAVMAPTPVGSPAYVAGIAQDDVIVSIGGANVTSADALERALGRLQPGARTRIDFERRGAGRVTAEVPVDEDPRLELVTVESTGGTLTEAQRVFRDAWFSSRAR